MRDLVVAWQRGQAYNCAYHVWAHLTLGRAAYRRRIAMPMVGAQRKALSCEMRMPMSDGRFQQLMARRCNTAWQQIVNALNVEW